MDTLSQFIVAMATSDLPEVDDQGRVSTFVSGYLIPFVRSFEAIPLGASRRDKLVILTNRFRLLAWPLRYVEARAGRNEGFKRRRTGRNETYRCRSEGITYCCVGPRSEEQLLSSYEPEVKNEISKTPRGDFLDVGAHIGVYALKTAARLRNQGRVVAIEPHPAYYAALIRAVLDNGFRNIKVLNAAAWSKPGTLLLHEHVIGASRVDHSVVLATGGDAISVRAITVDSVVQEEELDRLTLIKVDAEGAEPEILAGMSATLRRFPELRIIFEALDERALRSCAGVLGCHGFSVEMLAPPNYLALGPDAPRTPS